MSIERARTEAVAVSTTPDATASGRESIASSPSSRSPLNIVLVNEHRLFRHGLRLTLEQLDPRYQVAGAVTVMIACMQIPQIIALTYDQAALAAGDSKRFFVLAGSKAAMTVICLVIGLEVAGLFGALIGQGLAMLIIYPVVIWLSRSTGAWDRLHDLSLAVAGLMLAALAFWINRDAISGLAALN